MRKHILMVESWSKAEDRLMELLLATSNVENVDIERKETDDGLQYKEYRFDNEVFEDIRTYLGGEVL